MQKIIWLVIYGVFLLQSCQKSLDIPRNRTGGLDSTGNQLLVKYVERWGGADTFVINYSYDLNGLLTEENSPNGTGLTLYYRDAKNRVARCAFPLNVNDTAFTEVHYADENSEVITYTVLRATHSGAIALDSNVYIYNGNKLSKTLFYTFQADTAFCGNYYTWTYDSKNNISQLTNYTRNSGGTYDYNIGYDFTYDDNPNPFYSRDQVRQIMNWYISSSPNNLVKQVNHYGNPFAIPDDFIGLTYEYDATGKPVTSTRSGPAIGTSVVHSSYYYK